MVNVCCLLYFISCKKRAKLFCQSLYFICHIQAKFNESAIGIDLEK